MKTRFLIFSCLIFAIEACFRDIIWQSDFCLRTDSLPNNTILPPIDSECQFYIGDTLTLINTNPDLYENFYQVSTMDEMLTCNATNPINTIPLVINGNPISLNLVISNDFEFSVTRIIYLISTSSGDNISANNDVIKSPPCLQMSFHLSPISSIDCSLSSRCTASVLNDTSIVDFGCNFGIEEQTTTQTPLTTTTTTTTTAATAQQTITQATTQQTTTTTTSISNPTSNAITACLTFELNFCFDSIFFPLFALILVVSLFIVLASLFICYLKQCLCFSNCHKNAINPNIYYTPATEEILKKPLSNGLNPETNEETMDDNDRYNVQLTVVQPC